ncbi:DUF445 domain-containing protein [Paenibacillus sp. UMB4589-SE434]|uniref:DUF445 domain-containing protein n=1 Tax=Paenibacillus sp. UMB4589-SE434 TaxID=3046314 RepID=UPI002549D67E|nr:DUF445 domain-containing protein [Paenibacillus sp. UMB4589-SE434]MDK8183495.1 DUF445 domain-containing protein [Paenibacillus sp. UMB4589-SE434]
MNSKYLAVISLVVMAAGFVITLLLPQHVAVVLLQGGFEAGLVGGIADWFAVTALFRHPMGIPIPHTSLLLKNKARIVQSLVAAMETELLNKESIEKKLRGMNLIQRGASALTKVLGKRRVRRKVLEWLIQLVHRIPLEKLVPSIQSGLIAYVKKIDLKDSAEKLAAKIMEAGYDEKALDYVLLEATTWVNRRETKLMLSKLAGEKLSEVKMGGFMGFAFQAVAGFMDDDKLGGMLQNMIVSSLQDLQRPDNAYRETIVREIRVQMFQLASNEAYMEQAKTWLVTQLQQEQFEEALLARLQEVRDMLVNRLEQEQEAAGRLVLVTYRKVVRNLERDPDWIAALEAKVTSAIVSAVGANHYRLGQLVKENIDQMDDASLVAMLEEKIGKDLQWIRVNGALCGFIIGIVLALIHLL